MISEEGDSKKRGAEYSILEFFNGKVVTACDRTGNLDFVEKDEDFFHIMPCVDGEFVVCMQAAWSFACAVVCRP